MRLLVFFEFHLFDKLVQLICCGLPRLMQVACFTTLILLWRLDAVVVVFRHDCGHTNGQISARLDLNSGLPVVLDS